MGKMLFYFFIFEMYQKYPYYDQVFVLGKEENEFVKG